MKIHRPRQMLVAVIDLDSNATTAMHPEVLDAMLPWLRDQHANASGSYCAAKEARRAIEAAREQVAAAINAEPEEIVFTGSGTESVNTALHSLDRLAGEGRAVVSAIEHSAVLRTIESLPRQCVKLPVDAQGVLRTDLLEAACQGASYLSVMWANNEVGTIQPLGEVVAAARKHGLPVHSDAVQAVGKVPVDVRLAGVDLLSLSAHKFHGPKGIGALYVRGGMAFAPLLHGGGQEQGRRSGTENTASIVGMGVAARLAVEGLADMRRVAELRDAFERRLLEQVDGATVNAACVDRLPNTSHISFVGCDAAGLLILLDEAGVACSAGSACMTGRQQPSHVQLAMGIPPALAKSSLRLSFSRMNTMDEALAAATAVARAVEKLRRVQGGGVGPVVVYTP